MRSSSSRRKADIEVDDVSLVWLPYRLDTRRHGRARLSSCPIADTLIH